MKRCFAGMLTLAATLSLAAQTLPVSQVVLFTSGVGYFEHSGPITGTVTLPFAFREAQINDVLKSLVLRDATGTVGTVSYPSQDSSDHALRTFALNLSGPGGLASLLPQLRGTALTISTPADVTGTLVGLDQRPAGDRSETWLTLSTAEGLKTVPLGSVQGIKILDEALNLDLQRALALVGAQRDTSKKTVTLQFSGTGTRTASVGYIAEAPVWKTTYRLDLAGAKPFLQVWAIVENTTETDWKNIRLSLVSGRPVSFVQDLYTPLYRSRPLYVPEDEAGPAPQINAGGQPAMAFSSVPAPAPAPMSKSSRGQSAPAAEAMMDEELTAPAVSLRSPGVVSTASGAATGELFEFHLANPVTLARQQSALLPLRSGDVTAEKVSLFNAQQDSVHPRNAVWVTNSTGLRLPAGPVTVFDGGAYAGDSLTDSVLENDRRLWTYATDLALRVDTSESSVTTTTRISAVRGVLTSIREVLWKHRFALDNKSTAKKSLLIEQPFRSERTLVSPAKYEEKTPDLYRFRTEVPAGQQSTFEITEKQIVSETQSIVGWSRDSYLALIQQGGPLSPALKEALQKLADLRGRVDQHQVDLNVLTQQKAEEENGQSRIRSNLASVGRDSTQGAGYLKKLADSDARIDQLAAQIADKRQALASAQKDLDQALKNLTID